MQASFEAEVHGKAEALRNKKKLEQSVKELESQLEAANRFRAEGEKNSKKLQLQIISIQQVCLF
jgi:phage shock protein A